METIDMKAISRFVAKVAATNPIVPDDPLSHLTDSDTELIDLHIDYCVALQQLVPGDANSQQIWHQLRADYALHFEAWAVKHDLGYKFS